MFRLSTLAVLALLASTTEAFAPSSSSTSHASVVELSAMSRRDAMGAAFGLVLGTVGAVLEPANAASNPALETFKAKNKGQSFYPGKGMRDHEESFDRLVAASNPALETFKAKNKGQSFYPGKGMRDQESFDRLVAASNPALETFKAKNKGQSFYPGKGMRLHGDYLTEQS
eukprot:CAMPEP_0198154482 /NCGR_PEP_ID=MMETSP1443-20131203/68624_1 /TAXON_ID=186043 /ORGANISM="Entomoneis sp., Strain CCMP2396" /LENGTH=170 /DNA_ID=CAMNT_0043821161 /DNA_START=90 /DNA_END=605 /DNA_ORIENTATION=-